MSFFVYPTTNSWNENVFSLTTAGIIALVAVFLVLIASAVVTRTKKAGNVKTMAIKQLVFSGAAMALAIITAEIKFTRLPMGGSITLFSMLFIVLIGYLYGLRAGLITGFAYGLLQFLLDPVFYSPVQMIIDYPLAFGALGLSGFFSEKKYGLIKGYLLGVTGRYVFACISGVVFFGHYAPEGTPALLYSLGYNATYIVPEAFATILIISVPAVAKALLTVKRQAV